MPFQKLNNTHSFPEYITPEKDSHEINAAHQFLLAVYSKRRGRNKSTGKRYTNILVIFCMTALWVPLQLIGTPCKKTGLFTEDRFYNVWYKIMQFVLEFMQHLHCKLTIIMFIALMIIVFSVVSIRLSLCRTFQALNSGKIFCVYMSPASEVLCPLLFKNTNDYCYTIIP